MHRHALAWIGFTLSRRQRTSTEALGGFHGNLPASFRNDGNWTVGGLANWDDPSGYGHPGFQAYAFDLIHPLGGNVRAGRGGRVAFVQNVKGNTNDDPAVPPGGTAMWIRHADNSVALYAHMQVDSTKFAKDDAVLQGAVIGVSGNTGNAGGPHLHFEVRSFWNNEDDRGPTLPIQFEDENHLSWRPKYGDTLASNNTVQRQDEWRWCQKCQGLFFGGTPGLGTAGGKCPAGGAHAAIQSGNYILVVDSAAPGQPDWRWCNRCQGLWFAGHPVSKCPAGGSHSQTGSGNYTIVDLAVANPPSAPGQADWRWCNKCQGLFFGGNAASACPAGGQRRWRAQQNGQRKLQSARPRGRGQSGKRAGPAGLAVVQQMSRYVLRRKPRISMSCRRTAQQDGKRKLQRTGMSLPLPVTPVIKWRTAASTRSGQAACSSSRRRPATTSSIPARRLCTGKETLRAVAFFRGRHVQAAVLQHHAAARRAPSRHPPTEPPSRRPAPPRRPPPRVAASLQRSRSNAWTDW
jgi:Peptidase family M23